jgi:hypothetical protein
MGKAGFFGKAPRQRALAAGRIAVDGDDRTRCHGVTLQDFATLRKVPGYFSYLFSSRSIVPSGILASRGDENGE